MHRFIQVASRHTWGAHDTCNRLLLLLTVMGLLSGCIAKVQIPAVDQFRIASGAQEGLIDAHAQADILLDNLYQLMKANEGTDQGRHQRFRLGRPYSRGGQKNPLCFQRYRAR